jgi:pSer/pThr/pTyr-binding forkhead associated (FHA) protein
VEEGKVPPDLFSLSDSEPEAEKADALVMESDGGGRLGLGGDDGVDLATAVPEEDEAVQQVAQRFRRNKLSSVSFSAPSLDEQDAEEIDDDELQDFVLDALEHPEPEPEPAETLRVDVEHTGRMAGDTPKEAKLDQGGIICPSCGATNPSGMRFCVQCGGSLSIVSKSGGRRAPKPREAPPPTEAAREENPWAISLVSINEDGSDGVEIPLEYLETTIGREGDTRFPTDAFLSPKHARLHIDKGVLHIEDLYSLNGTFLKLRDEVRLTPGDTFLMGRQVLRFERFEQAITPKTKSSDGTRYMGSPSPGGSYKVLQIGIGGIVQNVYCLPESGAVLGREKGDIIFPHDKFMSSRHAQIYTGDDGHCYLVDLNSSNGTWIKIWEKTKLNDNDFIFMGQQLFRIRVEGRKR